MALSPSGDGYAASSGLGNNPDASLPMFNVDRVQLQFSLSADFVAAQVANNVLVLALATGRVLRIDLDSPADIDGWDLLPLLGSTNGRRYRSPQEVIRSWPYSKAFS